MENIEALDNKTLTKDVYQKIKGSNTEKQEIVRAIRAEHPGPEGSTMDVRHLWGDYYRVNYWGENEKGSIIVHSLFMNVKKVLDGFVITVHK